MITRQMTTKASNVTIFYLPVCASANTCPIPVCPGAVQYMLNDVLHNLEVFHYLLENIGLSECFTGVSFSLAQYQ